MNCGSGKLVAVDVDWFVDYTEQPTLAPWLEGLRRFLMQETMTAKQHKQDNAKKKCDRCQAQAAAIRECSFEFKHPLRYWKEVVSRVLGKRVTLRRQREFEEMFGFDWRRPPSFWIDLCAGCWEECSAPWSGLPMQFWEQVVLREGRAARKLVPTRSQKPSSGTISLSG